MCGLVIVETGKAMNEIRHCIFVAATNKNKVTVVPFSIVARLRAGRSGIRIWAGVKDFSLLHNVQTGCWANSASCSTGNGDSLRGRKAARVLG